MSILVAYATSHGSTREVAERISQRLKEQLAAQVECLPMSTLPRLSTAPAKYSGIVIGSAVHMGRWIGPGRHFVRNNAAFFKNKDENPPPVWAFSVCGAPEEEQAKAAPGYVKWFDKELGEGTVREHKMIRGRFEKDHLPWLLRVMFSCCVPEKEGQYGDFRNWDAIDEWANDLAKKMARENVVSSASGEQERQA